MSPVSSRVLPEELLGVEPSKSAPRVKRNTEAVRQAALLTLQDPLPERCALLLELSPRQWRQLSNWLHLSGLALCFYDRLGDLGWQPLLPADLTLSLEENMKDNAVRTRSMIDESIGIQNDFQEKNVRYAVLKGLSLWPSSYSKPELRSQFDLDFLVAEDSANAARSVLERKGYRLYNISGRSWEFKRNERLDVGMNEMYKDLQSWVVELHIEPSAAEQHSRLERREWRDLFGFRMPVLSPVDLYIGQAVHVYKHLMGEFMRASHLEEFRQHTLYRASDRQFWLKLQQSAGGDRAIAIKLALVIQLATQVAGEFAPEALRSWTVPQLSAEAKLWVRTYGNQSVFGSFPGTKRSLLLKGVLEESAIAVQQNMRISLLPLQLPPSIIRAHPGEDLGTSLARNWMQLKFIAHRLRFHLTAGFDFLWESRRWRRLLERAAQ